MGSTPTRATHQENRVGWALACPSGCNPPARGAMQVRLLPDALVSFAPSILTARTIWLVRLSAQDGGPSSRKGGFDSRTGQFTWKQENQKRAEIQKHPSAHAGGSPGAERTRDHIGQVVKLADTRRSDRRARMGLGVRLSPWSLEKASDKRRRGASAQWSLISSNRRVRHPDLLLIDR